MIGNADQLKSRVVDGITTLLGRPMISVWTSSEDRQVIRAVREFFRSASPAEGEELFKKFTQVSGTEDPVEDA